MSGSRVESGERVTMRTVEREDAGCFVQEGRVRKDWYWDGKYRDYVQYGLLREEWRDGD
jgi:RimJ/RimL family protein N-acetyltransferase